MDGTVVIKGFKAGIILVLNPDTSYETLKKDIADKFRASAAFFGEAAKAVSFKGRDLTDEQKMEIVDIIQANCSLSILCIMEDDPETEAAFQKTIERKLEQDYSNTGQFYKGTLKDGQILETENSIIVLGDVYPGACIISSKDIVVLGGLYGQAYAGGNGEEGHFVVALEMSPEKLKIGDFKYKTSEKQSKWSIKPKIQPKIAYVNDARVKIEPITKELLNDLPF